MSIKWLGLGLVGLLVVYLVLGAFTLSMRREGLHGLTGNVWNNVDRATQLLTRLESEVLYAYKDRQALYQTITAARNDLLAARAVGDLEKATNVAGRISVILEDNSLAGDLTPVQISLMDETAGSINRITYARSKLIEGQVGYNQTRIFFFPVAVFFPRVEVLGETANPAQQLPPSPFTPQ